MDPECALNVSQQPEEHRATMPDGPDPKCVRGLGLRLFRLF